MRVPVQLAPSFGALCARLALLGLLVVLAPSFGRFHWLIDLLAHPQIQAALCLTLLLTLTLALKRWKPSAFIGLVLALSLYRLSPLVLDPGKGEPIADGATLTVTTMNVLTTNPAKEQVTEYLRASSSDLLVLLETDQAWTRHLLAGLPEFPHHVSEVRADNFGALILSKFPLSEPVLHSPSPYGIPILEVLVETPLGKLHLLSAHPAPPMSAAASADRNTYLHALGEIARDSLHPVVIAGDLNATRWSSAYQGLLETARVHDLADGEGIHPTWKPFKTGLLGIPIDHLLCSPTLLATNYEVGPTLGSDHAPVTAVLTLRALAPP